MKRNLIFHNSNDLNASNSSEIELNDILTDELLSYSEDKSQALINLNPINKNNNKINTNNNQLKKITINKKEKNSCLNNSEITISFISSRNKSQFQKNAINEEKKNKNGINEVNNGNESNRDLSSLQISLSNLLSDIDSKDLFLSQLNKLTGNIPNNNINQINIYSTDNNNNKIDNSLNDKENSNFANKKINIQLKDKNYSNEDHSSSVCNYSHNLYMNNNSNNNSIKNNESKNFNIVRNNYYINDFEQNKEKNTKNSSKNHKHRRFINQKITEKLPFNKKGIIKN